MLANRKCIDEKMTTLEANFQEMATRSESSTENKIYIPLLPTTLENEHTLSAMPTNDDINPVFQIKKEPDETQYRYPDVHMEDFARTVIKSQDLEEDFCDKKSTINKSSQEIGLGQSVPNKIQNIDETFQTIVQNVIMKKDDSLDSKDGVTLWNENCNYQYKIEDTNKVNTLLELERICVVEYATVKEEKIDFEDNELGFELLSSKDEAHIEEDNCNFQTESEGERIYQCAHCHFKSNLRNCLVRHIKNLHIPKSEVFKCTECLYKTGVNTYLAEHFKRKHNKEIELYKCDECPYESKLKANLVQHYKRVHIIGQTNLYKCPQCPYESASKKYFTEHCDREHKMQNNLYKCDKCSYETKIKRYMTEHNRIHKEDQVYKCTKCSYETKIKKYFYNHSRGHDDRELYKCPECSYETRNKRYFTIHYNNRHKVTNEIYKCPECNFQAKVKRNLNEHLAIHRNTNETLKCSECSYQTKIKKYMTTHKREHHGDQTKVYKCSECPYETKIKSYLKSHTSNLHREETDLPYACPKCPYITVKKYCLGVHMRKHKSPKV